MNIDWSIVANIPQQSKTLIGKTEGRGWTENVRCLCSFCSFFFFCKPTAAKLLQSCPTLCDPIDSGRPGSAVPGILQARTLEWVAISFSNAWKWKVKMKSLSHVRLLATPWTAAYQAPPSMEFSRQEYWSRVLLPSPDVPAKNAKADSSHEIPDEPKLREILQNN